MVCIIKCTTSVTEMSCTGDWHFIKQRTNLPLLKSEIHLNNVQKFSSYLTDNALYIRYKDQVFKMCRKIISVYTENDMKCINTLCGRNLEFLDGKRLPLWSSGQSFWLQIHIWSMYEVNLERRMLDIILCKLLPLPWKFFIGNRRNKLVTKQFGLVVTLLDLYLGGALCESQPRH
jgi:hypothetical protein